MHPKLDSVVIDTSLNHFSLSQLFSKISGNSGLRDAQSAASITIPASTGSGT
jgi:hypothetical protein